MGPYNPQVGINPGFDGLPSGSGSGFSGSGSGGFNPLSLLPGGLGAVLQGVFNLLGVNSANDASLEAMREQNAWAYKMWRYNNEYNSPSAQMSRLRAAGINPALAYSNGMDNTSASVSETASNPSMKAWNMPQNPLALDPLAFHQAELLSAQAESARADAALKLAQVPEVDQRIMESQKRIDDLQSQIETRVAERGHLAELNKTEQEKRISMQFDRDLKNKQFELETRRVEALIRNYDANTANIKEQTRFLIQSMSARLLGLDLDNELKIDQMAEDIIGMRDLALSVQQGEISLQEAKDVLAATDMKNWDSRFDSWRDAAQYYLDHPEEAHSAARGHSRTPELWNMFESLVHAPQALAAGVVGLGLGKGVKSGVQLFKFPRKSAGFRQRNQN